jgi:hypothetical protein
MRTSAYAGFVGWVSRRARLHAAELFGVTYGRRMCVSGGGGLRHRARPAAGLLANPFYKVL